MFALARSPATMSSGDLLARSQVQRKIVRMADLAKRALEQPEDEDVVSNFLVHYEGVSKLETDFDAIHGAIESRFDTTTPPETVQLSNDLYDEVFEKLCFA